MQLILLRAPCHSAPLYRLPFCHFRLPCIFISPFPVRSALFLPYFSLTFMFPAGQTPRVSRPVMLGILFCLRVSLVAAPALDFVLRFFMRTPPRTVGASFLRP